MKSCLVVIDAQESFRHRPYFTERDLPVIELNEGAMRHLTCEHRLSVVPRAHHLFEEPGTLDIVVDLATRWFLSHFEESDNVRHVSRVS